MIDPKKFNDIFKNFDKKNVSSRPAKPAKQVLTPLQVESLNNRLERLTRQFKKAIQNRSLADAKIIILDLQQVLRSLGKTTKLVEFKNQLFELALEENDYDFAIQGFLSNRLIVSNSTRLHLEATALLAIAYLRKLEIEKAKPFIKDVLLNKKVIKTDTTREKFNREIINRFDEECALASLKSGGTIDVNDDVIHSEALRILNTLTEQQIFIQIGNLMPKFTKDLLYEGTGSLKTSCRLKNKKCFLHPKSLLRMSQQGEPYFRH